MFRGPDRSPALERALDATSQLKPGSWDAVEALAMLALASKDDQQAAAQLMGRANDAAAQLKVGSWGGVRALATVSWVSRELGIQ